MTKFYQYLNENGTSRTEPITESDAKELIRFNCKKSSLSTPIYRGMNRISSPYGFANSRSTNVIRKSANTQNFYTLLIDNSKEWEKYPKRSLSFICSTDIYEAGGYGNEIYRFFPYDGTKIGICSKQDMWISFKKSNITSLNIFNTFIRDMAKKFNYNETKLNNSFDYVTELLVDVGNNIEDIIKKDKDIILKNYFQKKNNYKNFYEYIMKEILNPEKNEFTIKKAGNNLPDAREVWFDGKAVIILDYEEEKILKNYKTILDWANDTKIDNDKNVLIT